MLDPTSAATLASESQKTTLLPAGHRIWNRLSRAAYRKAALPLGLFRERQILNYQTDDDRICDLLRDLRHWDGVDALLEEGALIEWVVATAEEHEGKGDTWRIYLGNLRSTTWVHMLTCWDGNTAEEAERQLREVAKLPQVDEKTMILQDLEDMRGDIKSAGCTRSPHILTSKRPLSEASPPRFDLLLDLIAPTKRRRLNSVSSGRTRHVLTKDSVSDPSLAECLLKDSGAARDEERRALQKPDIKICRNATAEDEQDRLVLVLHVPQRNSKSAELKTPQQVSPKAGGSQAMPKDREADQQPKLKRVIGKLVRHKKQVPQDHMDAGIGVKGDECREAEPGEEAWVPGREANEDAEHAEHLSSLQTAHQAKAKRAGYREASPSRPTTPGAQSIYEDAEDGLEASSAYGTPKTHLSETSTVVGMGESFHGPPCLAPQAVPDEEFLLGPQDDDSDASKVTISVRQDVRGHVEELPETKRKSHTGKLSVGVWLASTDSASEDHDEPRTSSDAADIVISSASGVPKPMNQDTIPSSLRSLQLNWRPVWKVSLPVMIKPPQSGPPVQVLEHRIETMRQSQELTARRLGIVNHARFHYPESLRPLDAEESYYVRHWINHIGLGSVNDDYARFLREKKMEVSSNVSRASLVVRRSNTGVPLQAVQRTKITDASTTRADAKHGLPTSQSVLAEGRIELKDSDAELTVVLSSFMSLGTKLMFEMKLPRASCYEPMVDLRFIEEARWGPDKCTQVKIPFTSEPNVPELATHYIAAQTWPKIYESKYHSSLLRLRGTHLRKQYPEVMLTMDEIEDARSHRTPENRENIMRQPRKHMTVRWHNEPFQGLAVEQDHKCEPEQDRRRSIQIQEEHRRYLSSRVLSQRHEDCRVEDETVDELVEVLESMAMQDAVVSLFEVEIRLHPDSSCTESEGGKTHELREDLENAKLQEAVEGLTRDHGALIPRVRLPSKSVYVDADEAKQDTKGSSTTATFASFVDSTHGERGPTVNRSFTFARNTKDSQVFDLSKDGGCLNTGEVVDSILFYGKKPPHLSCFEVAKHGKAHKTEEQKDVMQDGIEMKAKNQFDASRLSDNGIFDGLSASATTQVCGHEKMEGGYEMGDSNGEKRDGVVAGYPPEGGNKEGNDSSDNESDGGVLLEGYEHWTGRMGGRVGEWLGGVEDMN